MSIQSIQNPFVRRTVLIVVAVIWVPLCLLIVAPILGAAQSVTECAVDMPSALRSAWNGPKYRS